MVCSAFIRSAMAGLFCCASTAAIAQAEGVSYAPVPPWALRPATPSVVGAGANSSDTPLRIVYLDTDVRIDPTGEQNFTAYRVKLLKPEALAAGNISLAWYPSAGRAIVHHLRLIRGEKTTDILGTTKFRVLQREGALEQSVLDGQLTATLQVPGLQLGDELEFAATIVRNEPSFGGHAAGAHQFPVLGTGGLFRNRIGWPERMSLVVRPSPDLPAVQPQRADGYLTVFHELRDPVGALPTEGAPGRFNVRRAVEYSGFSSWAELSRVFWPMYDNASALGAASPVRAEAARIAAASSDPATRALAALRLVEEQVRYVYVGLDGANYRPASIDTTWQRRFGDCKAKTALLLALLRELGISAEPLLVASDGGDGLDERLPSPRLFDHVVIRATIRGKPLLLDGTRLGDRSLEALPPPLYRWGLPLRRSGATIERIGPKGPALPLYIGVVDIDSRAGLDADAKVEARDFMRGDEAIALHGKIVAMTAGDIDRALRTYWRQQLDWVEPDRVSWAYDERKAVLTFTVVGSGKPDWTGDDKDDHSLTLIGAGFTPPNSLKRPREQDQAAPWALEFPRFRCWATTVHLPKSTKWKWDFEARPMNRELGGVGYWRAAGLTADQVRTVMSRRALVPEISAGEAAALNRQIPSFNNSMSTVFQVPGGSTPELAPLPFGDSVDWVSDPAPCLPPAKS